MDAHLLYQVFQTLMTTVLVAGCTLYCLLTLAPSGLKRPMKLALLRCPLPAFIASWLRQATAAGACASHCGACASRSVRIQTVKWHLRQK